MKKDDYGVDYRNIIKPGVEEMFFTSTRQKLNVTAAQAIAQGISKDGGLFVPSEFPKFSQEMLDKLVNMNYKERACAVLSVYLNDFSAEEVEYCVNGAYTGTFDNEQPAPLVDLGNGCHMLELWHGPTCAFKDLALQILPFLLTVSAKKTAPGKTIVILVATSGDTGKAALAGFADVPGTKIIVFFPQNGVSPMQKLQMTTQTGKNVAVCAIEGNFDDAQTGVKKIFGDAAMQDFLKAGKMEFSSANSINFGRLAPQIVYYVSAYCDLVRDGKIKMGEPMNVAVPTGNFGNILAALYAKQMGIPIKKFVCASNKNNILTDFIKTGVYDRNRPFYTTSSPSMDILISSNLERLLYHLYNEDANAVSGLMKALSNDGKYQVSADVLAKLQAEFTGGYCDEEATQATISRLFKEKHYLCDTHTAVAVKVYDDYVKETGDQTPCVIASTASPYKFAADVLPAVDSAEIPADGFELLEKLSAVSDTPVPGPLAELKSKEVLHKTCVEKEEMADFIKSFLG